MQTLILVNANASGGKAVGVFKSIEPRMKELFGDLTVAVTEKPEDVGRHLDGTAGIDLVLGVATVLEKEDAESAPHGRAEGLEVGAENHAQAKP